MKKRPERIKECGVTQYVSPLCLWINTRKFRAKMRMRNSLLVDQTPKI
jgi:hypothetical protein